MSARSAAIFSGTTKVERLASSSFAVALAIRSRAPSGSGGLRSAKRCADAMKSSAFATASWYSRPARVNS